MTTQDAKSLFPLSQLSVLVSNYNKLAYLNQFFSLAEDILNLGCELVIIDDGSTDGSKEALLKWAEKRPRVIFQEETHNGSASVRNLALEIATQSWILFLDIDDSLNIQMLVQAIEAISLRSLDIVLGTMATKFEPNISTLPMSVSIPTESKMKTVQEKFFSGMAFQRYLYKRKFLQDNFCKFLPSLSLLNEKTFILDDIYFLLHIASVDADVLILPETYNFYVYTQHDSSIKAWKRYQQQCSLIPKASGLFLRQISKHSCNHDQEFLRRKILEIILIHLSYVNFLSACRALKDSMKLYYQAPRFFNFSFFDYKKIMTYSILVLWRSIKNSSFPMRRRIGLTGNK